MARNIVVGQRVSETKKLLAKEFRRKMTPEEKVLWQALRRNVRGAHFRRQQIIDGFIVDFYCHAAGLVVEVDGEVHRDREDYDRQRDEIMKARELIVLRFTNEEVRYGLEAVLRTIDAYLTPRPPSLRGKGERGKNKK